jgi:hypothetical protein
MTLEQLRAAQHQTPFIPFTICVADGQRISVPHSEFLHVPPGLVRTFAVWSSDGYYRILDLLLITTLEFKDAQMVRS